MEAKRRSEMVYLLWISAISAISAHKISATSSISAITGSALMNQYMCVGHCGLRRSPLPSPKGRALKLVQLVQLVRLN